MQFKFYSVQFKNPENDETITVNVNGKFSISPNREITQEEYVTYSLLAGLITGGGLPLEQIAEAKEAFYSEDELP